MIPISCCRRFLDLEVLCPTVALGKQVALASILPLNDQLPALVFQEVSR
jgi:hypothetical protein